jgi:alkanesulfonate monooxygenase SsuD/methylene tetrahydromethanopterin reductase-like flavin-dependent oxidoreductase (luciferase family)
LTDDRADAERALRDVLAPVLRRDAESLRDHLCIGSAEHCAEILSGYARAGCDWVQLWPLGDEPSQIERVANQVRPRIEA